MAMVVKKTIKFVHFRVLEFMRFILRRNLKRS